MFGQCVRLKDKYSWDLKESFQRVKDAKSIAQQKQKLIADKHRQEVIFKENDFVLLRFPKARLRVIVGNKEQGCPMDHQNYQAKLAKRYYGSFQIL